MNGYNVKTSDNDVLSSDSTSKYSITLNTSNEYDSYTKLYKNGKLITINDVSSLKANISNQSIKNYILYIGARNGESYFTKMNLANLKIYNKALSEDEIKHNYIIDKNRYGIEE